MKIKERYRRLNVWNKFSFWGAIASLISIMVTLLLWCISPDTTKIVQLLENDFRKQLEVKDLQIAFLQGQLERIQKPVEPSPRAQELAARIPLSADPYALALKAIAEKRFDESRTLLTEAQKTKGVELSKIYEARAQTEIFAGRYADAIEWYQMALALQPDNPGLLNETATSFYYAGKSAQAEPLYRRSLVIREKALGPEHPNVATSLNNLALLYYAQGKYAEAEPLYKRSLVIWEKALGPEHPNVAMSLNNLAGLYCAQGKYAEAEPLYKRSLAIVEKALGPEHPDVTTVRKNLYRLLKEKNAE
jgi:tetratricopeptide (TPR) repeat protein